VPKLSKAYRDLLPERPVFDRSNCRRCHCHYQPQGVACGEPDPEHA
jgi:hypothetical protein